MTSRGFISALLWPLVAMLAFGTLVWVERTGVPGGRQAPDKGPHLASPVLETENTGSEMECLVIYDGKADAMLHSNIEFVLGSMRVGYRCCNADNGQFIDPSGYRTIVLALMNLDLVQSSIMRIMDWVKAGGQLLVAYFPEPSTTLSAISEKIGILNTDLDYAVQQRARLTTELMPGGEGQEFTWSDGDRYGLVMQLSDACIVHMVSVSNDMGNVPMLWECPYGDGRVVVSNNDAFAERKSRGLVAAAYSLLGDVFCYPVINASMLFIDDFPAPVPEGHNKYIDRFYNIDVNSYYTNVWFPSMIGFARKYNLRYTGLMIETYDDNVTPPFEKTEQSERFRYFGNILMQDGDEIGLHGYNHQPLVPSSFHYAGLYDYKKWGSIGDMAASIQEALRFSAQAIPGSQLRTYVPPSNVLSDEAREMLRKDFPQINTISSVYMPGDLAYAQEFNVGADGIVNLPRINAGCEISDYDKWLELSELNFHYVNSHFLHPDDALDPERGADLGWEKLSSDLDSYLNWLYGAAKGLRNMTAQQGALAVRQYCGLSLKRKLSPSLYQLDIGGFPGEAWLLVRVNVGRPGSVKGGSLQPVCGDLYLLHAVAPHVEIQIEGGGLR
jgi:hypothetical protein